MEDDELMTVLMQHVADGNMEMDVMDGEPRVWLTEKGRARADELMGGLVEDGQHRDGSPRPWKL